MPKAKKKSTGKAAAQKSEKMRFLVVDDEKTARTVLKKHLMAIIPGCVIIEAENGAQAIRQYFHEKPDLIFLDILMPIVSGETVLDILEEDYHSGLTKNRPRVVVITQIDSARQLLALTKRFAVEAVLTKPIKKSDIQKLQASII